MHGKASVERKQHSVTTNVIDGGRHATLLIGATGKRVCGVNGHRQAKWGNGRRG